MSPVWLLPLLLFCSVLAEYDPKFTFEDKEILDLMNLNATEEIPGVCFVCRTVVMEAMRKLRPHETRGHVRRVLNSLCDTTHLIKNLCRKFVRNYGARLVTKLLHRSSARTICRILRLCWW
nr:PREDICTED: antimicrobial peptide NK-lysin-like [Lepisosteus oculatus]